MAEEDEGDSFDFRKLLETSWKGVDKKANSKEPVASTGDISTASASSKEELSGSKQTGAAPAVRAGLGRWAAILQQAPEAAGAAVEATPAASTPSDDNKDSTLDAEEDDDTDWKKILDSGWSKTLRKTSSGLSVTSAPVKSTLSKPGSGLGSCMSLLSKPSEEAISEPISAEISSASKAVTSTAAAAQPPPTVESTKAVDAPAEEDGEEDELDMKSFLDFAWGKAKTAKDTPTQYVEPVEADFITVDAGVEDPVVDGGEEPQVEDSVEAMEDAAEDALANMADQDEALQDNGEEVTEDLLEAEGLLENENDAAIEIDAEKVGDEVEDVEKVGDEVEDVEKVGDEVEEVENVGDAVDDAGQDAELSTEVDESAEVEEVVTFKGKDVGAVTVHATRSPTRPSKEEAEPKVMQPRAKGLAKAFLHGVTPDAKAKAKAARPPLPLKGAAAAFQQRAHFPKPGFMRPGMQTHQFGMAHGQLKPGLRPTGPKPPMGKPPMGKAHMGKAHMGKAHMGQAPMGKAFHGQGMASMGKPMHHQTPRAPIRPVTAGKFTPVKPTQPAQPPLARQLSGSIKPNNSGPAIKPSNSGPRVGLKRQGTDHSQPGSALKRQRSDDGPLAALDMEGRRFDLKRVVVNMANVGASYGTKVLKRGETSNTRAQGLLDWEGLRRCIKYLNQNLGLKVVGVIHENYSATDNNRGGKVPIPQDIHRMCESIEETPRLVGENHKSADDEMTIKCAYHRNCRFLDNDNYRDWKQQLRDDKVRAWLEKYQDLLHMRYYFDSGVGNFETIDGNVPPSMLAKELSGSNTKVNKAMLWTAPRQ